MPGDKILIDEKHREIAETIYRRLRQEESLQKGDRIVVSVYGGSGVGKSETASLLAYFLNSEGHRTYILSGDNYPRRIPESNDIERLGVFRNAGLSALAAREDFQNIFSKELEALKKEMLDILPASDPFIDPEWLKAYKQEGAQALREYLGTSKEIQFTLLNRVIEKFKTGEAAINLKRMGRTENDIYLEKMDFTDKQVLLIEWTHGNNPLLMGVDYPVFLYSSPAETLEHRKNRARDSNTETHLISLVLQLEHDMLMQQLESAKLIVSKKNRILTPADIREVLK